MKEDFENDKNKGKAKVSPPKKSPERETSKQSNTRSNVNSQLQQLPPSEIRPSEMRQADIDVVQYAVSKLHKQNQMPYVSNTD